MPDAAILDLGAFTHSGVTARRWLAADLYVPAALLVLAVATGFVAGDGISNVARALDRIGWRKPQPAATIRVELDQLRMVDNLTVDDKAQIVVEGAAAQDRNAAIPVSDLPIENVRSFLLAGAGEGNYATALKCLTQAVYYEAAVEPLDGKRAVAQVVINRMRHPAYPKSICGVVYQGSERRTGCQFSFTCDGALLRTPAAAAWMSAGAVAREALNGHIEASVGTSTHYHADYVLPKWAFQLGKIEQLGRHIFYRFNGSWGKSAAFIGRYSGLERIPAIDYIALRARASSNDAEPAVDSVVPGLTVAPHITDRHAATDVGGRIDVTKAWRLSIPDPTQANTRYRQAIGEAPAALAVSEKVAANHVTEAVADQ